MSEFQCPYAQPGQRRCVPAICDCFIDTHPDSPFELHPEDFLVGVKYEPTPTTDPREQRSTEG